MRIWISILICCIVHFSESIELFILAFPVRANLILLYERHECTMNISQYLQGPISNLSFNALRYFETVEINYFRIEHSEKLFINVLVMALSWASTILVDHWQLVLLCLLGGGFQWFVVKFIQHRRFYAGLVRKPPN
jgi:hypothetical protein